MLAGAVQLALVRGKLTSRWWTLSLSFTLLVSAAAFLIHEQNPWLFSRAAFLHHAIGWTLLVAAIFPLGQVLQPRRAVWSAGFAMTWVVLAVMLFCDRDVAPIFGHLSDSPAAPSETFARRGSRSRRSRSRAPPSRTRLSSAASPATQSRLGGAAAGRRASLRPGGDDHGAGDRGVLGRRGARSPARPCRAATAASSACRSPACERGESYTVRWRATSSDGHTGSGVYTFGIGVTPPPPTEAYGSTGPTWTDDVARWAFFVALALLVGTIGLRLLVLREPLPPRLSNRLYGLAAAGGIATLNVGIAAFVMRAADALQVPFVDLLYGDLSPIATKTRFGIAFVAMTLGYAVVTALVLLAWILDRPRLLWPAFVVGTRVRDGPLALGPSGRRAQRDLPHRSRRLAPSRRRDPVGRRPRRSRDLRLAARARAPSDRVSRLLAHRDRPRRRARAGRHVPLDRAAAERVRPLVDDRTGRPCSSRSRSSASRSAGVRCTTSSCGPGSSRDDAPRGVRRSLIGESTVAILVLLVAAVLVNARPPAVEPAGGVRAGTSD